MKLDALNNCQLFEANTCEQAHGLRSFLFGHFLHKSPRCLRRFYGISKEIVRFFFCSKGLRFLERRVLARSQF